MSSRSAEVEFRGRSDWFFNTNETYVKNAYNQMLAQSAVALYGYKPGVGERKLFRPRRGDRVFAYVNEVGIVACGSFIDDDVLPSRGIFHAGAEREFRRRVKWTHLVNPERAISFQDVKEWGYQLPVRSTLAKIDDDEIGDRIERRFVRLGDDRL